MNADARLVMLPLRFPPEVKLRAEKLVGPISADSDFTSIKVTVAHVLRMAVMRGLASLEETYR